METVIFQGVEEERTRKIFLETLNQFDDLKKYKLILRQKKIKGTTMQAQPVISIANLLGGPDTYKIKLARYVRNSESIKISNLPENVLKGWFAHELGHVVDYAPHSTFQMITYGLKYLFSDSFKKAVEHRADEIAIDAGFHQEILATKEFVFNHDLIDEPYKDQMRKYYMSIEAVEMCVKEKSLMQPTSQEI
ncbi:hypothetical protein [Ekhidna sp.]|uniref:hypothetical protein n=1 Tax=Ekhidna sp. TaxID=2608089 RepID=UPI003299E867